MKTIRPFVRACLWMASTLVAGLVLSGCGENRPARAEESLPFQSGSLEVAVEPSTRASADAVGLTPQLPTAEKAERDEQELLERERELAAREARLAERERELAAVDAGAEADTSRFEAPADAAVETAEDEIKFGDTTVPREAPLPADASLPVYPRRLGESLPVEQTAAFERTAVFDLPAGTLLEIALGEPLSSETSLTGDRFTASLASDVVREDFIVIPAGTRVFGEITEAVPQKKIGGQARLAARFDRLELASGTSIPIAASLVLEGERQSQKDAATIGGAAAGGAILGRVLKNRDRDKGTLVGAILGAAIGTAVAAENEGDPVVLDEGTVLSIALDTPAEISVP
ncbi:MAG: glycine zipper 2TM domain-containing protein [Acidobacteriota bacterium]|nr:MAG: glycine zipper 2TM domain-containing protein [Acidobacteriota bacterium]